jgi:hypothetical protein
MRLYAYADGTLARLPCEEFPSPIYGTLPAGLTLALEFDEATNTGLVAALDAHWASYTALSGALYRDGQAVMVNSPGQAWLDRVAADAAKTAFRNLPNWATWTAAEASGYVHSDVLGGWTKAQLDSYVDTNVTNIATARTALKQLGEELIDLRAICERLAEAVVYLRDVAVRRAT